MDARLRRSGLTLAAQSLSSVTNFTAGVLALWAATTIASFGHFAIAFQLSQLVIAIGQGSTGNAVLIHGAGTDQGRSQDIRDGAAAASVLIGGIFGVGLLVTAAVISNGLSDTLVVAAVGAPALAAQYTLRAIRFSGSDPVGVIRADGIWLAVLLGALVIDLVGPWYFHPNDYLLAWVLGAIVSALPMVRPALRGRSKLAAFWAACGPQTVRMGVEAFFARSIFVVSLLTVEIVVGTRASGAFAAAVLIFSPMTIVHTSAYALIVPQQVRRRGVHVMRASYAAAIGLVLTAVVCAWAAFVWVVDVAGHGPGPFSLANNGITGVLFAATLIRFAGLSLWHGPGVAMRVADSARESLRVRISGAGVQWGTMLIGLSLGDLEGGAIGLGIGTCISAGLAWSQFVHLSRRPVEEPQREERPDTVA